MRAAASSIASGNPSRRAQNLGHRRGIVIRDGEIGAGMAGPIGEQLNRLVGQRPATATRQLSSPATPIASRLVARSVSPHAAPNKAMTSSALASSKMLTVVQHHQHLTVANKPQQGVHGGAAGLIR